MKASWHRPVNKLWRIPNFPFTVLGTEDITAWYRRIRFSSPACVEVVEPCPTLWFRLWAPHPSQGADVQRGYTFVEIDKDRGEFTADFVLHAAPGAAGDWAKAAAPGVTGEVALTPNRPKVPGGTSRLVLAGDVTALPAINSWIEQAPAEWAIDAFIADSHPDHDALPLSRRSGTTVTWLPADGGVSLAKAVEEAGGGEHVYGWAAGERDAVKRVRVAFKDGLGLAKNQQFSQFYWFEGRETG